MLALILTSCFQPHINSFIYTDLFASTKIYEKNTNHIHDHWNDSSKMSQFFKYDPEYNISDYTDRDLKKKDTIIFSHGFGDKRYIKRKNEQSNFKKNYNSSSQHQKTNYCCITYNYQSATKINEESLICNTDFGGLKEAEVALYPIVKSFEKGSRNIILFGHSCGAASQIRALHILEEIDKKVITSGKEMYCYEKTAKKTGLWNKKTNCPDIKKAKKIKQSIKKVFAITPLLDINKTITFTILKPIRYMKPTITNKKTPLNWIKKNACLPIMLFVEKLIKNNIAPCFIKNILPEISRYDQSEKQPIELLKTLKSDNIDISLAKNDNIVGNMLDGKIITIAKNKNWTINSKNVIHNNLDHGLKKLLEYHSYKNQSLYSRYKNNFSKHMKSLNTKENFHNIVAF